MPDGGAAIRTRRPIAVINTGSGGWNASAAGQMKAIFARAGWPDAEVISVPPARVDAALKRAVAVADLVVAFGGDGTLRSAAARCSEAGKLLVPLPGGTMNMLPHALFGAGRWQDVLTNTLADPWVRDVSGGRVGDHLFFCAAVFGAPSLWADAREALRRADVVGATRCALRAARRTAREPLRYRLGDRMSGTAQAIAVLCPLVSRAMAEDELSLEAAAVEPIAGGALFRLAFHSVFDDWRNDPSVSLAKVTHIEVNGRGRIPAILDGEKVRVARTVAVDFVPRAFRVLIPRGPAP
jgi:diacylglycerol kinase family enzyme